MYVLTFGYGPRLFVVDRPADDRFVELDLQRSQSHLHADERAVFDAGNSVNNDIGMFVVDFFASDTTRVLYRNTSNGCAITSFSLTGKLN